MLRKVVGRRLASASVIALVVACSYDWSIGTGSPTEQPSGTSGTSGSTETPDGSSTPPSDAGSKDAGLPECGPSCECKDKETCRFGCTTGRCELKCSGTADCKLTCANGATCTTTCEDNSKCDLDCTAGRSTCKVECKDQATCTGDCRATLRCTKDCLRPCDVKCSGGGICL